MGSKPIQLNEIIEEFCKTYGFYDGIIKKRILENWETIIGPVISNNAKIIKYQNNTLYIKTNSSIWKTELLSKKNEIIDLVNKAIGEKIVQKLVIK